MSGDIIVFSLSSIPITIISVVWIVIISKQLIHSTRDYRLTKRKFFPDERIRTRCLYNLETHIVKDTLLLILTSLELFGPLSGAIYNLNTIGHNPWFYITDFNLTQSPEDCSNYKLFVDLLISQNLCSKFCNNWDISFLWQVMFGLCFFMTTLSILCRYLSARYLIHPYKRVFAGYIAWLCVQFIIFLPALSKHTLGLTFLLSLIILCIDWILLIRDHKRLKSILEGYLKEFEFHANKRRYIYERRVYITYRVAMTLLVSAFFFSLLTVTLANLIHCLATALSNKCILYWMRRRQTVARIHEIYSLCFRVLNGFMSSFLAIHYLLLCLPLHLMTVAAFIFNCYKQWRGVKKEYLRYNHEIMQGLINGQRRNRMR